MTTTAPRLLTPAQVGKHFGVHEDTVRRWVAAGKLRAVDIGTTKYPRLRIREDDLTQFIEDRTHSAPAALTG